MGAFYDEIPEHIVDWIYAQHMFWVATAPLTPTGHVNVSPKGLKGTFKVLDRSTVFYQVCVTLAFLTQLLDCALGRT